MPGAGRFGSVGRFSTDRALCVDVHIRPWPCSSAAGPQQMSACHKAARFMQLFNARERAWAWTPPSATANAENAIVMHGRMRSPGHSLLRACSEASGFRRGGFGATGPYAVGTAHQNTAAVRTLSHGRLMRFGRTAAVYSGELPLVWLAGPRHNARAAGPLCFGIDGGSGCIGPKLLS